MMTGEMLISGARHTAREYYGPGLNAPRITCTVIGRDDGGTVLGMSRSCMSGWALYCLGSDDLWHCLSTRQGRLVRPIWIEGRKYTRLQGYANQSGEFMDLPRPTMLLEGSGGRRSVWDGVPASTTHRPRRTRPGA
jgi:hypothetical protein